MGEPTVSYAPRPDTTPETELSALTCVYRFILDCHAKKKPAGATPATRRKGSLDDLPVSPILPRD